MTQRSVIIVSFIFALMFLTPVSAVEITPTFYGKAVNDNIGTILCTISGSTGTCTNSQGNIGDITLENITYQTQGDLTTVSFTGIPTEQPQNLSYRFQTNFISINNDNTLQGSMFDTVEDTTRQLLGNFVFNGAQGMKQDFNNDGKWDFTDYIKKLVVIKNLINPTPDQVWQMNLSGEDSNLNKEQFLAKNVGLSATQLKTKYITPDDLNFDTQHILDITLRLQQ